MMMMRAAIARVEVTTTMIDKANGGKSLKRPAATPNYVTTPLFYCLAR